MQKQYFIFGEENVLEYLENGASAKISKTVSFDPELDTGARLLEAFIGFSSFLPIPREDYKTIVGQSRYCTACGKKLSGGYVVNEGEAYYCTQPCMETHIPKSQCQDMEKKSEIRYKLWEV